MQAGPEPVCKKNFRYVGELEGKRFFFAFSEKKRVFLKNL